VTSRSQGVLDLTLHSRVVISDENPRHGGGAPPGSLV